MKSLIVEDDFTCRLLLQEMLKKYGEAHVAVNGKEAVTAASIALETKKPYDLICLDIMMPEMDGQEALKQIRDVEEKHGVFSWKGQGSKILMTTALDDMKNVMQAFRGLCDGYLVKPIKKNNLIKEMNKLGLLPADE